ncbi:PQQ enzyme-like repeat protein [Rhizobium azibense]|nr:PQQ enzyme-like repeat protein [Rhizobium azibense]
MVSRGRVIGDVMYVHTPFPNTVYALDLNEGKENVMPAFGENKNVYRNLDDLSAYLCARAVGDAPRGCPPKKADRLQAAKDHEANCIGG